MVFIAPDLLRRWMECAPEFMDKNEAAKDPKDPVPPVIVKLPRRSAVTFEGPLLSSCKADFLTTCAFSISPKIGESVGFTL